MPDAKPRLRKWRLLAILAGVALSAVVVDFLFGLTGLFQWSPLNCWHEEVDVRTGRIRCTRYLFCQKISERVRDSELTKALAPADLQGVEAHWHRVNTFSPGVRYSPHYRYHGAIGTIYMLNTAWEHAGFAREARRRCALTILELWQADGNCFRAEKYALAVADVAFRTGGTLPIGVQHLPPVPQK